MNFFRLCFSGCGAAKSYRPIRHKHRFIYTYKAQRTGENIACGSHNCESVFFPNRNGEIYKGESQREIRERKNKQAHLMTHSVEHRTGQRIGKHYRTKRCKTHCQICRALCVIKHCAYFTAEYNKEQTDRRADRNPDAICFGGGVFKAFCAAFFRT